MLNSRRLSLSFLAALALVAVAVLLAVPVSGQPPAPPPAPVAGQPQKVQPGFGKKGGVQPDLKQPVYVPGVKFSAIKLVESDEYQRSIESAMDAIEGGDWPDACAHLQAILDSKQDSFIRVEMDKGGTKSVISASAKRKANDLIGSLPKDGLEAYELKFGGSARQLLDEAKKLGNREKLADVAWRYLHTRAGLEANDLLATLFMDRGDYHPAALRYQYLLGQQPAKAKVSDLTLFKAALAYKRAGEKDFTQRAQELLDILLPRIKGNGGLSLANGQTASLKQVQAVFDDWVVPIQANLHDWPMVNGSVSRNAQAKGSPPILDFVLWSRQLLQDKTDDAGEPEPGASLKPLFDFYLKESKKPGNVAVMPGGFPIASNGILFYRTYAGITSVYLRDQLDKDGNIEAKAGSVNWRGGTPFEGALGTIFDVPTMKGPLDNWINNIYKVSGLTNLLYENSTVGTLTTDGRNVYAVDDLALPIPPKYLMQNFINNQSYVSDELRKLVKQNRLKAYNVDNGKIAWELGGDSKDYAESHFLCAPISVGGKLYVLNEKNTGDLRLLCLDPATGKMLMPPQKLGTVRSDHLYFHDIARRANALHLAYGEGILVCPTNAGEILGIDLLSQSLAWAYKYRDKPPNPLAVAKQFDNQPTGAMALSYSNWKVAPPIVVEGKVVFTAPDSSAVCCINLRDGTEVWNAPQQESDLFLAGVFHDKVVIVGKNTIRALKLSDGAPAWQPLQTGDLPSGQGVASNDIYYLPLRKGEICAIDVANWTIKAHNQAARAGGEPPGNLVFYEGMVLSQTAETIVAYPQLVAKLTEAEAAYAKDSSALNLFNRGELRLADGQVQKAVDDLKAVLGKDPPEQIAVRARQKLYDALCQLLQTDFAKSAAKYLGDFKELTKVPGKPAEQFQREARYWRVVGQGREDQGALVDAFLAYKEYGASPLFRDDGIPSLEDPLYKVPAQLWLRGRISAMFARANAAQRADLEKKIAEEWAAVKTRDDPDAIRQFTAMFDVPFTVGREARLELADVIIKNKTKGAFLEAELNLLQLCVGNFRNDAKVGGKAVLALAQMEEAKDTPDSLRMAAGYYRELNDRFGKAALAGDKTGAELFGAIAKDPRFQPFLQEQVFSWGQADLKSREIKGSGAQFQGFVFQPAGEMSSQMRRFRLVLDGAPNNQTPALRLVDTASGKQRWTVALPANPYNSQFFSYLYNEVNQPSGFHPNAKFRFFQARGHLAVIQIGLSAYGIDMDAGKVLWQHNLYDPTRVQGAIGGWSLMLDDMGYIVAAQNTQTGQLTKTRVGQIGTVQPTYVALVTQQGLVALDPLKGTVLWTKKGLATNTEMFGDDQHIYYVETANGVAVGPGRCLRASDGAPEEVQDFASFYRSQQRIFGGRLILTAEQGNKAVTLRLYDVPGGKDLWKRTFTNDPAVLHTEDTDQCGVIERDTGKLYLLEAHTGKEIMTAAMKQFRVSAEDLKEMHEPLLLDDGEFYFVALNSRYAATPIQNNTLSNNFSSGTRCQPVNGWLCCLDRKGEFLWHATDRLMNQMIVVEEFKKLPILLFSSRFMVLSPNSGQVYFAHSCSLAKSNGKALWSTPDNGSPSNRSAQFSALIIDQKAKTVNMIGNSMNGNNTTIQHYLDEGEMKKGN